MNSDSGYETDLYLRLGTRQKRNLLPVPQGSFPDKLEKSLLEKSSTRPPTSNLAYYLNVKAFTSNPFKFLGTTLCPLSGDHRNPGLYQQLRVFLSRSSPLLQ